MSSQQGPSEGKPSPAVPEFLSASGSSSLESFLGHALKSAARATAASQALPGDKAQDWDYYNTFAGFRRIMKTEKGAAEGIIQKLLQWNGVKNHHGRTSDVKDFLELLSEANDQILERISTNLDEAAGIKRQGDPELMSVAAGGSNGPAVALSGSWNRRKSGGAEVKLLTAKNVSRPQLGFKDLVDNTANPFIPRLKEKPNSKKPLSILPEYADDNTEFYSHPYIYELDLLKHSEQQLGKEDPGRIVPLEEAEFTFVSTEQQLRDMIAVLKKEPVIGVDTEHHSYRTFLGLTSLIQISSPTKDYVVDPFPLWRELTALNEVFTDPKIVKVLHGADSEIGWLQRDFSVYMVNIFDTHLAAKTLNFPPGCRSFAYVLKNFCNVNTDKQFQLADWRIRPLSEDMLRYARMDTRFHIYIYRAMKNALLDAGNETKNLLRSTLDLGSALCKARYDKPRITPTTHLDMMRKCRMTFNSRQLFALKEIFAWRNKTAREEDESEAFVLPVHMLLKICTELPREMQGILACCNPIPPLVKQSLGVLHLVILKAREQPLTLLRDDIEATARKNIDQLEAMHSNVVEDPLKCPLDLGAAKERSGEEKVLLDAEGVIQGAFINSKDSMIELKKKPVLAVFGKVNTAADDTSAQVKDFLSPYQRYQMLKPYLKFLAGKDESGKSESATDDQRVNSIKEHFDALTAMTAADFAGGDEKAADQQEEESEDDEEMEEKYGDAGEVKQLRVKKSKTGNKKKAGIKRPSDAKEDGVTPAKAAKMPEEEEEVKDMDYENSDWGQFSNKGKKNDGGPKGQFNPWEKFEKNAKKAGGGGGKQKQRYKAGGKSHSYKK